MRFAGVRASPRRVRRVMGENDLLAPHRVGRAESKPHDGTIVTNRLTRYQTQPSRQVATTRERVSIAHRLRPNQRMIALLAILRLLAASVANLFKSRRWLETEKLFLRHQLNIALR